MQIQLDQKGSTLATLNLRIEEADYEPKVQERIKEMAKTAQLKGFRKGKVPQPILRKMMGPELIQDEVIRTLQESLNEYLNKENLTLVGQPLPSEDQDAPDWQSQKDFEFKYDLGIVPAFDLDFKKVNVTDYDVEIEESTIEEAVTGLLLQNGIVDEPEEVDADDFVAGEIKQVEGDLEGTIMLQLSKLGVQEAKKFHGKKVDETVTFKLQKAFKQDFFAIAQASSLTQDEAEKAEGDFEVKITGIKRLNNEKLDQEAYDKLFGPDKVHNEDELKAEVEKILGESIDENNKSLGYREIRESLVDNTTVEFSEEFFKNWLKASNEGVSDEDLDKEFDALKKELKWNLIRDKVATEGEIQVKAEEIRAKAEEVVKAQFLGGMPVSEEMADVFKNLVDNYLQHENGRNYQQISMSALSEKVFEYVKEQAKAKSKKIKSEAFKKVLNQA